MHALLMQFEKEELLTIGRQKTQSHQLVHLKKQLNNLCQMKHELTEHCHRLRSDDASQYLSPGAIFTKEMDQLSRLCRMIAQNKETLRITFQTSYAGEPYEQYWADVFLEPFTVNQHNLPSSVPLVQIFKDCLVNGADHTVEHFSWSVYRHLQAVVSRRQEIAVAKNSVPAGVVSFLHASYPYDFIEFNINRPCDESESGYLCTVQLSYPDVLMTLPSCTLLLNDNGELSRDGDLVERVEAVLQADRLSRALPEAVRMLSSCLSKSPD